MMKFHEVLLFIRPDMTEKLFTGTLSNISNLLFTLPSFIDKADKNIRRPFQRHHEERFWQRRSHTDRYVRNVFSKSRELSLSMENVCDKQRKSTQIVERFNRQVSKSMENLWPGSEESNFILRHKAKMNNRLSKSIDNLDIKEEKETTMPRFLSKATDVFRLKRFRKNRPKEAKHRSAVLEHLHGDFSETDKEIAYEEIRDPVHLVGAKGDELHGYKGHIIKDDMDHKTNPRDFICKSVLLDRTELRLSKDYSCDRQQKAMTTIFPDGVKHFNRQISRSAENLCSGSSVSRNTFKMTNRLSKSMNCLYLKEEKDMKMTKFLLKATNALGIKRFRRNKPKEDKRRPRALEHLELDDFGETYSGIADDDMDNYSGVHRVKVADEELYGYKDIRTSHYLETSSKETCTNPRCNAVFSFYVHPHHCRRCGEVFCTNCLRLRRNLNRLAQPDPDGLPCKVCESCFQENDESDVITTRSLTEDFVSLRTKSRSERNNTYCEITLERRMASNVPSFWREQFKIDMKQECQRLLNGFGESMRNSGTYVHKTVQELRKLVEVPCWQRSRYWTLEKTVSSCRVCHSRFRKFHKQQKLRNCRVCGLALCKTCANKELLVYFEDGEINNNERKPKISIIKYDGCPEVEPELSVLLYICKDCKSEILSKQLEAADWYEDRPEQVDVMSLVEKIYAEVAVVQEAVKRRVDELQRLVQETEQALQGRPQITLLAFAMKLNRHAAPVVTSILQQIDDCIARQEEDLSKFPTYIDKMKIFLECEKISTKERILLKNLIKGKCDFYLQQKQILGEMKNKTGSL